MFRKTSPPCGPPDRNRRAGLAGKSDLVNGSYELRAPNGKTKVVVKIVDMLGEEVVEVREG
jgi:hypothetical protein